MDHRTLATLHDWLRFARQRVGVYGEAEAPHLFGITPPRLRAALDQRLVELNHPLAHEPGTQEQRFCALACGRVNLEASQ